MKRLLFDPCYVAPIRARSKTTTFRAPRPNLPTAGELVDLRSRGATFGTAVVVKVELLGLYNLTNADALDDGFPDADTLRRRLERYYPNVNEFVKLTFRLAGEPPVRKESRK